jgi:integrase
MAKRKPSKLGPSLTAKHEVFDGKAVILRYRHCGDWWHFRMYVKGERRYIQESLRTKNFAAALDKAQEKFITEQARILAGEKIFSITAEELRDRYLRHVKNRKVETGQLSEGRLTNITVHTRHYLDFVGKKSKIQNIDPKFFLDYLVFRRKEKKDILLSTVRNEQITIASMYKFAVKEGLISHSSIPEFETIKVPVDEGRREGLTLNEFRKLKQVSEQWHRRVPQTADKAEEQVYYRRLLHDFIMIQGHYGLRTGELRNLRWEDVEVYDNGTARICIRAENTKVRKMRTATTRHTADFTRIKSYARYLGRRDFVFSAYHKNQQWPRLLLYKYFRELKEEVKAQYGEEFDASKTLYGLRHLFITKKLRLGHNPWEIARFTGTSIRQITTTYDNVLDEQIGQKFLKRKSAWDQDGNPVDLEEEKGD